jgi:hypothetical protein
MTTLPVHDPAMCFSTGICGAEIDQRLVDLAADLEWLKTPAVTVRRFGLSREPAEFAANDTIRQIMQESEGDDLPVFLVDGALMAKARHPSRAELADWSGVADNPTTQHPEASSCFGTAEQEKAVVGGCCGGADSVPPREKADGCC